MTRRAPSDLSDEDRILWSQVARTVTPLGPGRAGPEEAPADPAPPPAAEKAAARPAPPMPSYTPPPPRHRPVATSIDAPTLDKLSKERLPIEGRVDLHGMTQEQAHALLLMFLHRAHLRGIRHVLVITGKGSSRGGDGVLRRLVPAWLATAPFRAIVSSHHGAARHHGGGGALYVRLRRKQG